MQRPLLAACALGLLLAFFGCGGGGGDGGGDSGGHLTAPTLYVGDTGDDTALIWQDAAVTDGDVPPSAVIGGPVNAQFDNPYGIHYDSRGDTLIVGDLENSAIKFFDGVAAMDGDVTPTRTLAGASTMIAGSNAYEVFVDEVRDLLYVVHTDGVFVYANAATIDGDVAPSRNITGAATGFSSDRDKRIFLDATNNRLYIIDGTAASLMVYDGASSADGNMAPSRTVSGSNTGFGFPWGIAVDVGRNLVYVSDETNNEIYVFDSAGSIDGNIAPNRIISGLATTLSGPSGIDVDPISNMLYVPHFPAANATVSVWHDASTANGNVMPTRDITGGSTALNVPQDVVVAR